MCLLKPHILSMVAVLLVLVSMTAALKPPAGRGVLDLDGEWHFALNPADPATKRLAAAGQKVTGTIHVPGAWMAQGYGEQNDYLWHQFAGVGIYSRNVSLPTGFSAAGRRLILVVERAHRSVKLSVGGHLVAQHVGYLSTLEADVTDVAAGGTLQVQLAVNGTKDVNGLDGLYGSGDMLPLPGDGVQFGGWGGLAGHVRLESRSSAWLANPHVQHQVSLNLSNSLVNATVELGGSMTASALQYLKLSVKLLDPHGVVEGILQGQCGVTPATNISLCTAGSIVLQSPELWSPRTPSVHTAVFELLDMSAGKGLVVDSMEVSFGLRHLEVVDGYHWRLNGDALFLWGYGDESMYPTHIAPPANRSFFAEQIAVRRGLGFNYVRLHSEVPPMDYFDAACAAGLLVSVQFPFDAYGPTWTCPGNGCDSMLNHEWLSVIRQVRNYPCVLDYVMDNEFDALTFAKRWYAEAKMLDPSRPVSTADGVGGASNPEDVRYTQFDQFEVPLGEPHQFAVGKPVAPVVAHEFLDVGTWPMIDKSIASFNASGSVVRPFWLEPVRNRLAKLGLLEENAVWTAAGNHLYLATAKNYIETLRKSEGISGYQWWVIQDWYMGNMGVLDVQGVPKFSSSQLDEVRALNAEVMLLVSEPGDELPLAKDSSQLMRAYADGEVLNTSIHVSNLAVGVIKSATLHWSVVMIPASGPNVTLCSASVQTPTIVSQTGATLAAAGVGCKLTHPSLSGASRLPLSLMLVASLTAMDGTSLSAGTWRSRVYPLVQSEAPPHGVTMYVDSALCNLIPIKGACGLPPRGTVPPAGSVMVVNHLSEALLEFAVRGNATIVLLDNGAQPKCVTSETVYMVSRQLYGATFWLPGESARWKQSWWLDDSYGSSNGYVVYENPTTAGMAPGGWTDEGWYRLINTARNFLLDELPGPVDVLVRAIDVMQSSIYWQLKARQKALLWQVGLVGSGALDPSGIPSGALVAAGLNLLHEGNSWGASAADSKVTVPESAWLLRQILHHACQAPRPLRRFRVNQSTCLTCFPQTSTRLMAADAENPVEASTAAPNRYV